MHIFDDSRTASRLLVQRLIDFRFAPLIAVQYTFCDFPSLLYVDVCRTPFHDGKTFMGTPSMQFSAHKVTRLHVPAA
jgi:hypothetical protein